MSENDIASLQSALTDVTSRVAELEKQVALANAQISNDIPRILSAVENLSRQIGKMADKWNSDALDAKLKAQANEINLNVLERRIDELEEAHQDQTKFNLKLVGLGTGGGAIVAAFFEAMKAFMGA